MENLKQKNVFNHINLIFMATLIFLFLLVIFMSLSLTFVPNLNEFDVQSTLYYQLLIKLIMVCLLLQTLNTIIKNILNKQINKKSLISLIIVFYAAMLSGVIINWISINDNCIPTLNFPQSNISNYLPIYGFLLIGVGIVGMSLSLKFNKWKSIIILILLLASYITIIIFSSICYDYYDDKVAFLWKTLSFIYLFQYLLFFMFFYLTIEIINVRVLICTLILIGLGIIIFWITRDFDISANTYPNLLPADKEKILKCIQFFGVGLILTCCTIPYLTSILNWKKIEKVIKN